MYSVHTLLLVKYSVKKPYVATAEALFLLTGDVTSSGASAREQHAPV